MTDEQLMRAYRDGSEEAFTALYGKYSPLVWSFVKRRLRSSEAEDFFQKVWRQLHEKRSLFQEQPFAPWFFVLIRNLLTDEYRSLGRQARELRAEFGQKEDNLAGQELEEILETLPADSAALVRKYYLDGFSYEELEKETGLSQSNLRQRLSRTLRGLRAKVRGVE